MKSEEGVMKSNLVKLTPQYLRIRHEFWKEEIGKVGIWDSNKFMPIKLIIRKNHRRYNALFQRRRNLRNNTVEDKIVVYNKVESFEIKFLDSLIVHEMIHQYLTQNDLGSQSPHGLQFRDMMNKINEKFKGQLNIQIRSNNPTIPSKGEGESIHNILLVFKNNQCYCCVIHPKRILKFDKIIKDLKRKGKIKDFKWAQSKDFYFNDFSRCMKVLSGRVFPLNAIQQFCQEYKVIVASTNAKKLN